MFTTKLLRSREGKKFAGKFSRETRLCKLAPRVNSRVSLYNNRPFAGDGCYTSSINAACIVRASRMLRFELCHSANTKLGQHRWHAIPARVFLVRIDRFVRSELLLESFEKRSWISPRPIYIYIYKNRKLFSPALLWKTYIRGAKRGGEKGEKKNFHPSFIHVLVITSISISRRISNSRSRMYIGYKDASVSVQRAAPVANIKQGRGGPVCAGAPRENRGVYIHAYVCMYMHPRYTKHIGRLSGAGKQPQSKQFARLIDFPWHPRFGVHATRCVHPPPPRWRRQACDRASTDLPIG